MWTRWYSSAHFEIVKILLAPLLSYVINESICDGVFPDNLKIAKVAPIFKSGDSQIPANDRPIISSNILFKNLRKSTVRKT